INQSGLEQRQQNFSHNLEQGQTTDEGRLLQLRMNLRQRVIDDARGEADPADRVNDDENRQAPVKRNYIAQQEERHEHSGNGENQMRHRVGQKRDGIEDKPKLQARPQHRPGNRQTENQRQRRHRNHQDQSVPRAVEHELPRQAVKVRERYLLHGFERRRLKKLEQRSPHEQKKRQQLADEKVTAEKQPSDQPTPFAQFDQARPVAFASDHGVAMRETQHAEISPAQKQRQHNQEHADNRRHFEGGQPDGKNIDRRGDDAGKRERQRDVTQRAKNSQAVNPRRFF